MFTCNRNNIQFSKTAERWESTWQIRWDHKESVSEHLAKKCHSHNTTYLPIVINLLFYEPNEQSIKGNSTKVYLLLKRNINLVK